MSFINFGNNASQAGFQNALAVGLQLGQQGAEGANRRGFNNALANVDLSNPDSIKEVTRFRPEVGVQLQQQAQQQQQAAAAQAAEQRAKMRSLLQAAGDNPQAAFAAAQAEGIDVSRIPPPNSPEFEPWRQTQLFIFDTLERPDGEKIITESMKEVMGALPPENRNINDPAFIQAWTQHMAAKRQKTIPFQPGGGIIEYDPATGETRILAGPSGSPSAVQVPPPPEGFTLDGDVSGNAGGGF